MIGTRVWCYDKDIFGFNGTIVLNVEDSVGYLIARDYDGAVFYRTNREFEVSKPKPKEPVG